MSKTTKVYIKGFKMADSCKNCDNGYYSHGLYYCGIGTPDFKHRLVSDKIDAIDSHCPLVVEAYEDKEEDDLK